MHKNIFFFEKRISAFLCSSGFHMKAKPHIDMRLSSLNIMNIAVHTWRRNG